MTRALLPAGRGRESLWVRLRQRIADALERLAARVRGGLVVQVVEASEIAEGAQVVEIGERITVAQVQKFLGVSRRTVTNLVKRGKLTKQTSEIAGAHGLRVYFIRAEVERLRGSGVRLKPKRKARRKAKAKGRRGKR